MLWIYYEGKLLSGQYNGEKLLLCQQWMFLLNVFINVLKLFLLNIFINVLPLVLRSS